MESLTHESEQIKEVFAPFGLAIYQAQCLERSLAMAVATVYGPGPQKLTKSGYEKLLQSNFKRTLGRLIAELRESVVVDGDLEAMLNEALRKRNWLSHEYFWERAVQFTNPRGREAMTQELHEVADFLGEVDRRLSTILREWRVSHGIDDEMVRQEWEKLLHAAISD